MSFLITLPFLLAAPEAKAATQTAAAAITAEQADISYQSYRATFWRPSNKTYYKLDNKTGELDYWMWAHAWEVEMDAYERLRTPATLQAIRDCYDGFVAKNGTDLQDRDYNDDIGWWVMAATRAYDLTGITAYRDLAKKNFDWMWTNQVDNVFGGGIWWMNTNKRQKNSASTLPFSVSGFKLGRQLNDPSYTEKAKALHAWNRLKLFRDYGEVADRIEMVNGVETVIWGPLSYNHGTWVSSAWEMFKATGDSVHFKDAINTLEYFKNILSNKTTGILPDERGDGTGNTDNDAGQYKTVFVHYVMRFLMEAKQWQYLPWMNANAESLWRNRRVTDNLMYFAWATPTPTQAGRLGAQMASGGVALLNQLVVAESMQAFYMEGTDTTTAQGRGLWNEFTVDATGLSGDGNSLALYMPPAATDHGIYRPYPHSFADIRKAPTDFAPFFADRVAGSDFTGRTFVLKMTDTTYAKVALLRKFPDNRYLYRYGVSRVKRNTILAEIDYSRSVRYKPNNLQVLAAVSPAPAGQTVTAFKWEPPLANANALTGYEVYAMDVAKADTTKAANLAQWMRIGTTAAAGTAFTWTRVGDDAPKYVNLVAVYATGTSLPLEGWLSIPNKKAPSVATAPTPEAAAGTASDRKRTGTYFRYSWMRRGGSSEVEVFDPAGRRMPADF